MGQYGLEALSRGAKKAILCDKSKEAIQIIKSNVEKTHFQEKAEMQNNDFEKCLRTIKEKLDYIYIDPPYQTDYIFEALRILEKSEILKEDTKIILETDDDQRILKQIQALDFEITDQRKYGIAHIIFLRKK